MKMLMGTWEKGIAKVVNHPEAKVGDKVQLTDEEINDLDGYEEYGEVYMVVSHILGDILLGDLAVYGEVAGFGIAVADSPFCVW